MARSTSLPHRVVVQAKGLLLAGEGIANNEIARRCDTTPNAVRRWRSKFDAEGLDGVGRIRPGRGRKPELAPELIEAIVHDTLGSQGELERLVGSCSRAMSGRRPLQVPPA